MWTDEDTELALVWQELTTVCPVCGVPLIDAMDPATADAWDVEPEVCQSCRAIEHRQHLDHEAYQENPASIDLTGRKYPAVLNEGRVRRG